MRYIYTHRQQSFYYKLLRINNNVESDEVCVMFVDKNGIREVIE